MGRIRLEEYQYQIKYKPGKTNSNADRLSRLPAKSDQVNVTIKAVRSYEDFINFEKTNQEVVSFEKTNSLLKKQKDPIFLFWSQDLKENNQYFKYIFNRLH